MLWENVKGGTEQPSAQDIRCVTHGSNQTSQQKPEKRNKIMQKGYIEKEPTCLLTQIPSTYTGNHQGFFRILYQQKSSKPGPKWTDMGGNEGRLLEYQDSAVRK